MATKQAMRLSAAELLREIQAAHTEREYLDLINRAGFFILQHSNPEEQLSFRQSERPYDWTERCHSHQDCRRVATQVKVLLQLIGPKGMPGER